MRGKVYNYAWNRGETNTATPLQSIHYKTLRHSDFIRYRRSNRYSLQASNPHVNLSTNISNITPLVNHKHSLSLKSIPESKLKNNETILESPIEKSEITMYNPKIILEDKSIRFLLNIEKFKLLCEMREWKYPASDLARATGYSRAYCLKIIKHQEKLSDIMMLKLIRISGADPRNPKSWGSLFIPCCNADLSISSPQMNMEKYHARAPYNYASGSYELRKRDNPDHQERPLSDFVSQITT